MILRHTLRQVLWAINLNAVTYKAAAGAKPAWKNHAFIGDMAVTGRCETLVRYGLVTFDEAWAAGHYTITAKGRKHL